MKKSPKKKAEKKAEPQFSISLTIGGKTYKGSGATPAEALSALSHPPKLMAKGIVCVSHGSARKEILLTPLMLKKLFYPSPSLRAVKAKQIFASMK